MAVPLLKTKLYLPPLRDQQVSRKRLLLHLDQITRPGVRLGLISAPAGFGKTSLLAEWVRQQPTPAAWLSIDAGDNTNGVFLAYLVFAIQQAKPGTLLETQALLSTDPPPPTETLLSTLINELSEECSSENAALMLVLDDFQFITSAEIRQIIHFLVENIPAGLRLVIATRSDPPLALARLRARGQMVELRAADLRFTPSEATAFLDQRMGLHFDQATRQEVMTTLSDRTEGWIAGLQMAALALQAGSAVDPLHFVKTFNGNNRFVLDYLAEEVLSHLPEKSVDFLLATSILDRFCAGLCQEVTGGESVLSQQQIIEALDRSNLFLVPLDTERCWFRYHHLFGDLLRARLKQFTPDHIPELHRRAAAWFERNDWIAEAIQHTVAASAAAASVGVNSEADYQHAAQLVEQHTIALFTRGELHALERWVNLLPADLVDRRAWLCLYRAWMVVFSGRIPEIEPNLRKTEAQIQSLPEEEQRTLNGHCAAIRCHRAALVVNTPLEDPNSFQYAEQARQALPEGDWALGVMEWSVGFILRAKGQLEQAAEVLERIGQTSRANGDAWGVAMILTDLGIVYRQQGKILKAQAANQSGLAFLEQQGARKLGYAGRFLTGCAAVCYEQNDLPAAQALLNEAIDLNQRWRNPNHLVFSYLNLARVEMALGNFASAENCLASAARVLEQLPVIISLRQSLENMQITLHFMQHHSAPYPEKLQAEIQTALHDVSGEPAYSEPRQMRSLLLVRVLLVQGQPEPALRLLAGLAESAHRGKRVTEWVEVRTLQALAFYQQGDAAAALSSLQSGLEECRSEIFRTVIDCAPTPNLVSALAALLNTLGRKQPAYQVQTSALLEALTSCQALAEPGAPLSATPAIKLVETLSEREIEVLRLIAQGLTNVQIASQLIISTGTVKAHTANIFRKLDAENRTQAVAKARGAGLLTD
jgi:LuxR family maltose regulon positive regulatory protein